MEHEPVELRASPDALRALTGAITRYRVEQVPGFGEDVSAVWIDAGQLYLVSVDIMGLAFKFEVCTLRVQTPAEALATAEANRPAMEQAWAEMRAAGVPIPVFALPAEPSPAGPLEDWPFRSWRFDILRRKEFIIDPVHLPDDPGDRQRYFENLGQGQAPQHSEHSCTATIGLLFTSDDGRRLLIVSDGMPGFMRVTDEEDVTQAYLRTCEVVPAPEYARRL
jgi:hypothetical protein